MRKINFFYCIAGLLLISNMCLAQLSVTSYSIYSIGISSNTDKKIGFEFKTFANRELTETIFELEGFYHFKKREFHQFSLGVGIGSQPMFDSPFYSITTPFQLQIFPLKDFQKLSLIFELCPEYLIDDDLINLRSLWGIRYRFGS